MVNIDMNLGKFLQKYEKQIYLDKSSYPPS